MFIFGFKNIYAVISPICCMSCVIFDPIQETGPKVGGGHTFTKTTLSEAAKGTAVLTISKMMHGTYIVLTSNVY